MSDRSRSTEPRCWPCLVRNNAAVTVDAVATPQDDQHAHRLAQLGQLASPRRSDGRRPTSPDRAGTAAWGTHRSSHARWATVFLMASFCAQPASGQENTAPPVPEEAVQRLRQLHGRWQFQTEYLNAAGEVTGRTSGTEEVEWLVEDRVLGMTSRLDGDRVGSRAMWFYDRTTLEFTLVSVNGSTGELWVLGGDLDQWQIRSRVTPPGSAQIRFTHYDVEQDSWRALMEYSTDGGDTWLPGFRQVFSRVSKAG